jgi:AcrR family transcriptional regulator
MARTDSRRDADEPAWRQRAISRSLSAARTRAEKRLQRFLDAAFELVDEKGTTDFTIQEVVDRSKQSLRSFYQYFDGKDELLLALFEETTRSSMEDIREVIESETEPLARLRAFTIRLHEWCEPFETPRKRGSHNRLPISEFSLLLTVRHPERVAAVVAPLSRMLVELVDDAAAAGAIQVADTQRAGVLIQQTVMYSWLVNQLIPNPRLHSSAEEIWEFCLHGLRG